MTKRYPVVMEKNKGKERVIIMLKYKNMVTRKAIDNNSGNMETFVLVLILLLFHCMTLEKSSAFFLIQLFLLYSLGESSYPVLWIYLYALRKQYHWWLRIKILLSNRTGFKSRTYHSPAT